MHSRMFERLSEDTCEEWIAVVDEVATPKQKSVFAVRPVPGDLMHPGSAWGGDDAGDLDSTGLEVDYEQHEVPNESAAT